MNGPRNMSTFRSCSRFWKDVDHWSSQNQRQKGFDQLRTMLCNPVLLSPLFVLYYYRCKHIMWGNELLGSVLRFPRAFLVSIVVYLLLLLLVKESF